MSKKKSKYEGHAIKYGKDPTVWIVHEGKRYKALSYGDYKTLPFVHVTLEELSTIPDSGLHMFDKYQDEEE